jgi:hypothetical protein
MFHSVTLPITTPKLPVYLEYSNLIIGLKKDLMSKEIRKGEVNKKGSLPAA